MQGASFNISQTKACSENRLTFNSDLGVVNICMKGLGLKSQGIYLEAINCVRSHLVIQDCVHIHISMIMYDTGLIKGLIDLFNLLNRYWREGKDITVSWFVPDDDPDMVDLANYIYDLTLDILPE